MHDSCQSQCPNHVHHVQEAAKAAPSVSKDTEMEDAGLASEGVKDNDGKTVEGGSKGTKRALEHEADAENSALTHAPSAKRQKTDADWGELLDIQSLLTVLATCGLGSPCAVIQCSKVGAWLKSFYRERQSAVVS